jgi:fatty-acyl-CoA synthase
VSTTQGSSPTEIQFICNHSEARILVGDGELLDRIIGTDFDTVREIVETPQQNGNYLGVGTRYEELISHGSAHASARWEVDDENAVITINYTSGTTGRPKGVMYTHRGTYLASIGNAITQGFSIDTRYLWTLPMFHCNGWCGPCSVTAVSGVHVCLRAVRATAIWQLIDEEGINRMSGAPTVLTTLASAPEAHEVTTPMSIVTAGAPPSPTVITSIRDLGIDLVHVYGLTETYGPYAVCEPGTDWQERDTQERDTQELSRLMARQGVGMLTADPLRVVRTDAPSGELVDVVADGAEMGEILMRGNVVMKGYYKDPERTAAAFAGGWFHSGDLGVIHPDGYVQLLDRAKDVVISGGENISTIEVEQAIDSHPAVAEVAVVGAPDDDWGERPVANVVLRQGATVTAEELSAHVKATIASYKVPREFRFCETLPKTSTGKIRKKELRENVWIGKAHRVQG